MEDSYRVAVIDQVDRHAIGGTQFAKEGNRLIANPQLIDEAGVQVVDQDDGHRCRSIDDPVAERRYGWCRFGDDC